ncbi:hypothetical protein Tco_0089192 [Tanacetum coccineum]
MSQPANDEFSQHLSDDEASNMKMHQTLVLNLNKNNRAMEMKHYLEYIDNDVWKVIQNGNSKKRISTGKDGVISNTSTSIVTAAEIQAVEKERKAKNILLMAIPKENLKKIFMEWDVAKEIWEAIRIGLVETQIQRKKMPRRLFSKQQFESIYNIPVQKGSLPLAWSNLAMTMRTKPDVDTLSIDDLYNNLRVFEKEIQGASKTSSSAQNVAFVSIAKASSTIEVLAGYVDEVFIPLAKQSETGLASETWRVRVDGKSPVGFDKKKLECFNCHNTAGKQEKNQMGLLTMDDGIVNWGEHTEVEETNHALMAISSSNEANEIYEKDEKLKRYRRIGMKAVKEKEQLQKTLDSWKDSSKNLWRLIDSGMSSNSKVGLGFEIQSNNEVLSYEEEMNFSVFNCSKEDSIGKPLYSRFTKTNDFKGVPHPLSGDYTPKPQEEIDDSLYVYGKKGPQKPEISVSDDNSSEHSTCQSNDSEGSCGNTSEHSFETESESLSVPNEMSKSRLEVTNEKDVSAPKSKEVEPSCVSHIKTPRQPLKDKETHKVNRKNWNDMMERELGEGYSFTKKKCFVCGSLSHLIKDCDYYEKKMAREAEVKRVVNTGNGVAKSVWTNANRINHSNKFVPRSVQLNAGRPQFNSVRPHINAGRPQFNSVRPKVNSVSPKVNAVSPKINTVRPRQPVSSKTSNSSSPKRPQMNQMNQRRDFSRGDLLLRNHQQEHPLKNMVDRGIFDSGCSGHMTGNKDQLEDFEEFNGGSVTFGGSKGYISGKGRIRVGNLDFDSVSFVKELGHFNLFSISQICDKQHKQSAEQIRSSCSSQSYPQAAKKQSQRSTSLFVCMFSLSQEEPKKICRIFNKKTVWYNPASRTVTVQASTSKGSCKITSKNEAPVARIEAIRTTIQAEQKEEIFISHDKYVLEIPKKFDLDNVYFPPQRLPHTQCCQEIFKYLKGKPKLGISNPDESAGLLRKWTHTLRFSNLRYALTTNPTIYDSLVQQFWQTATANTNADGSLEINATIDTIRWQFEKQYKVFELPSTSSPPPITTPTPIPVTIPTPIPVTTPTPPPIYTPTPTPTPLPDTEPTPFEHIYEEPSPVHQHFSPTHEQAQGQMSMDDLLQTVPKLISRIDSLVTDLKQTKLTMGNAIVKFVKKVKKLEGFLKRRNMVLSDSEEEESKAQGRKSQDDPLILPYNEELQTKTPKRLKDDEDHEAKDDESTKKFGKRRKQMARKGLHTSIDKDDSEGSNEDSEQDDSVTGTKTPINLVLVAMKTPGIATYKIIKQGEKGAYQIVREDGTDIVYINLLSMLEKCIINDLTGRSGITDPVWSVLSQKRIISWRYYDTCRVHCLNLESMDIYMLSERKYPLSAEVCQTMLKMKLLDGKMNDDCYKMLKMMEKQDGIRK